MQVKSGYKKVLLIMIFLTLSAVAFLGAEGLENLYEMVVPFEHDRLEVSGGFIGSDDLFRFIVSPIGTVSVDVRGEADYYSILQTEDRQILFDLNADVQVGTSQILILAQTDAPVDYTLYNMDINGMEGFVSLGGDADISFSSGGGFVFDLDPQVGVGIGREHGIFQILRAELLMETLGIIPTEEKVRAVAEIFTRSFITLDQYREDESELFREYIRELALAMGVPGRELDIVYAAASQEYAFKLNRYVGLTHGMAAEAYLAFHTDNIGGTLNFGGDLGFTGVLNGYILDNALHYRAGGVLELGFSTAAGFGLDLNFNGTATYLPEDYHWWVEAAFTAGIGLAGGTFTFPVTLSGTANYMLTPNFTTFAEAALSSTGNIIGISAGGVWRLW